MWERRSFLDGGTSQRCTVKFKGQIPPWPDTVALGVEWDEPARGRNNGDFNDVQYFQCLVPGAGSFVKASRTHETEVSVGTAIYSKYVDNSAFTEVKLSGGKSFETVGVDKVHEIYQDVENLSVISLEGSRVKSVSGGPLNISTLRSLKSLDLSNNLLETFDDVLELISLLPSLSSLRINGNRLRFNAEKVVPHLREVHASNVLMTEDDISRMSRCFPGTRTLSLAQNRLTSVPKVLPSHLTTLDLSDNFISTLANLPASLNALLVAGNYIKEVSSDLSHLEILDIRGLPLDWHSISHVGASNIKDLHITHLEHQEEAHRAFVIARCPRVLKLNGTAVTLKERFDAELYTINAVEKKKHIMLPSDIWQELLRKYGEPAPLSDHSIRARLIAFYIGNNPNPFRIVRDAPLPRLWKLISRATGIPLREMRLTKIRGCREYDTQPSLLFTVEELIEDGSRLQIEGRQREHEHV